MARPEYIRIKLSDIPEDVIERYKLRDIVDTDGYVYLLGDMTLDSNLD